MFRMPRDLMKRSKDEYDSSIATNPTEETLVGLMVVKKTSGNLLFGLILGLPPAQIRPVVCILTRNTLRIHKGYSVNAIKEVNRFFERFDKSIYFRWRIVNSTGWL